MKIRDIQKYLEGYNPESNLNLLGTDEEPFLETLYGVGQEIDSTIRDVASFASNSEEQLFYEFVQNAFDADADSLCFFVDKDWLIVLNNGEPFYTDPRGRKLRDGQLYNFLAKGKSLKAGDKTKSGEFGQGSKLLYTLISDKSTASNKTQLLKAIKEAKKGPYIISWASPEQLSDLRFREDGWQMTDPYSGQDDLLVAKILMTYYPVAPGMDERLFPSSEYFSIRDAFERLVDPKSNINRLSRGTAIIVPLGSGQYEAISAKDNLKKVSQRLGSFVSLTANKVRNSGKHLDHIFVCGEEVEMHEVKSVFIDFNKDDDDFEYQFAFNPAFAKNDNVNLFKTLPVIQAHYGLGFLIDSQNFELDSSRQRINDTGKTRLQLTEAFRRLQTRICKIKGQDRELFDYIYASIVASQPLKNNTEVQFISDPFYETFKPFVKENVKTSDGDYLPLEKVVEDITDEPRIPLAKVGITDVKWINEEMSKGRLRQRFELNDMNSYGIEDILSDADPAKLSEWVKSLSDDEYLIYHPFFAQYCACEDGMDNLKVFMSNKGNTYSFAEIKSHNLNVYFFRKSQDLSFLKRCPDLEYILGGIDYYADNAENNEALSIMKISRNIEFFRNSSSHTDVACNILNSCYNSAYAEAITTKIPLLKNLKGEYHCFAELISEAPEGTSVLSDFCVAGYVPAALHEEWMVSNDEDIWCWVMEHLEDIKQLGDWGEFHEKYLGDLKDLFLKAGDSSKMQRITLCLDNDGVPTDENIFSIATNKSLSPEEYDILSDFAETKGYPLVPYKFRKALCEAPFELDDVKVKEILDQRSTVDVPLLDIIVKLYPEILYNFRVVSSGSDFIITHEEHCNNFTCRIVDSAADKILASRGHHRIEDSVLQHFSNVDISDFSIDSNPDRMLQIIDDVESTNLLHLLPYVKISNENVVRSFFGHLDSIEINSSISDTDSRWQAILLAFSKFGDGDDFYRKRLLNIIRHKGGLLPDTIKSNKVIYGETVYDLYKLLGQVQVDNELVDSLLECLPDGEHFRSTMYRGKEETADPADVYNELCEKALSVEQLRFCLDYCLHEAGASNDVLSLKNPDELPSALSMISRYQFKGFDRNLKIPGFDKSIQVFGDEKLLLSQERLPASLSHWFSSDPVAQTLVDDLMHDSDPHISFRKDLLDNTLNLNAGAVTSNAAKLSRTMQWAIEQKFQILEGSSRYLTLKNIISRHPKNCSPLPMLRFTGNVQEYPEGLWNHVLSLEYLPSNGYLAEYSNVLTYGNSRMLLKNKSVQDFFLKHRIYGYDTPSFLSDQGLTARSRYVFKTAAEEKAYEELNDDLYNKWRKMKESEGVRIFRSSSPIGTIFSIVREPDHVVEFDVKDKDHLFGYNFDLKHVIIQFPNTSCPTEMKTLESASKEIDFFKNPFISLQGLYIEMMQELTPEELAMVIANKDRINNVLEDLSTDDEDSPESKVRQMIGYIGEQVFKLYLEKNGVDYEYSAANGVGEYDFKVPGKGGQQDIYIDVKTNLYTFVDAAVPFYIHKSQNKFMQTHPEAQYRIVRISLTDIRLKKEYEHIRDYFGPEADVNTNQELRDRCEKIALNYWRGAKIREFDAASPEYGIRIEKKKK